MKYTVVSDIFLAWTRVL